MDQSVIFVAPLEEQESITSINKNTVVDVPVHTCGQDYEFVNDILVCLTCGTDFEAKLSAVFPNMDHRRFRIQYNTNVKKVVLDTTSTQDHVGTTKDESDSHSSNTEDNNNKGDDSEDSNSNSNSNSDDSNSNSNSNTNDDNNEDSGDSNEDSGSNESDTDYEYRDEFTNVEDMNPIKHNTIKYNPEYTKAMLNVVIPKMFAVLSLYDWYLGIKDCHTVYSLVMKYGTREVYNYFLQRIPYKVCNIMNCDLDTILAEIAIDPSNLTDISVRYSQHIMVALTSINIDREAARFERYIRAKREAYWRKILVSFSIGLTIAYLIALIGTIVFIR